MKQLTCEMCGSTDLMKQDGVFVCQTCGCKYSVEEAKKLLVEISGQVDVSGSTVKVDNSQELDNLYLLARRAKEENNCENAANYYDMILVKDPTNWEPTFYSVYFKSMQCTIAQIESVGTLISNCIENVFKLIQNYVKDENEQKKAYTEVSTKVLNILELLFNNAEKSYKETDFSIKSELKNTWAKNASATINCVWALGDTLDSFFGMDLEANILSKIAWKQGIDWIKYCSDNWAIGETGKLVFDYAKKINKYDSSYSLDEKYSLFQCDTSYIKDSVAKGSKKIKEIRTVTHLNFYENTLDSLVYDSQPKRFIHDEDFSELYSNLRYSVDECKYGFTMKLLFLTIYTRESSYTMITMLDSYGNGITPSSHTKIVTNSTGDLVMCTEPKTTLSKTEFDEIIEILNNKGVTRM